ncbi:globin-like [Ornithodoros turicata]|uniref:globin-like n=1 Tax=Ornithodoros turicata TaxID=34597 RepID=UPI003138C222
MTLAEITAVQTTWPRFYQHKDNGIELFIELFTWYPECKLLFKSFAEQSVTSLFSDPQLVGHTIAVLYQITAMVDALDDADLFEELVRKNATQHVRRPGVHAKHISSFTQVLKSVLRQKMGTSMTPDATSGWDKFLQLVVNITQDVYTKAADSPHHRAKHDLKRE